MTEPDEPPEGTQRVLAQFRNPAEIRRVEKDGNVEYRRVALLAAGVWTDAGSRQTVDYAAEGLRASAENWVDIERVRAAIPEWERLSNGQRAERLAELGDDILADEVPINFLHGPSLYGAESLDAVGHIPTDSVLVDDDGTLYADLVFHADTDQSRTAIDLMDETLEKATAGTRPPPVGPSVEIPADRVTATDRDVLTLKEAWFSAAGIVFNPASETVELGQQAATRAVAMSSAAGGGSLLYRGLQTNVINFSNVGGDPFESQEMLVAFLNTLASEADRVWLGDNEWPSDDVSGWPKQEDGDGFPIHDRPVIAEDIDLETARKVWANFEDEAYALGGPREGKPGNGPVLSGQTLKAALRHRWRMSDPTDDELPAFADMNDEELARTLETMDEDFEELKRVLQGEADDAMVAVLDAVQQYASAGEDMTAGADAFREWAAANAEIDEDALDDVLSAYLQASGAEDLGETPVEEFQMWLAEQASAEAPEEGGEPEEEEQPQLEDLAKVKETLGQFADHMNDIKDLLTAAESDRREFREDVERRLSKIEDEPEPRSLAGDASGPFVSEASTERDDEEFVPSTPPR